MGRTKEERAARKKVRQARKEQRKEKLKVLVALTKNAPDIGDEEFLDQPKQEFTKYWPALRAVLDFAAFLKVTGEKVDETIYRIIYIGNKMASTNAEVNVSDEEQEEFMDKMQKIWGISRKVLYAATIFTKDDVDDKIEKAIEIGDWITSIDDD